MKLIRTNTFFPYLIILLFVTIAYLPVILPFFYLKNDVVTQILPTRYFIGESIHSGAMPWWNPYINYGIPQYGDMNSGFWNPIMWLLASIFGYSIYTITFEELLYILIGGIGFYHLIKKWTKPDQPLALTMACVYITSGYVVGHLQHFVWITAVAFFPFVLLTFLNCIQKTSTSNLIKGGLASFMFVSSAHPGLVIGGVYFFIFLTIYLSIYFDVLNFKNTKQVFKGAALFSIVSFLFSLIVIFCYSELFSFMTRGEKVSLSQSLINPTSLQSYISIFVPSATFKNNTFFNTDISMRNMYTGIIPLISFLFFFKKFSRAIALLIPLVFFILLSSGGWFKTWAYDYIPFAGFVRSNGEFSYFTIFIILLISSAGIQALFQNLPFLKKYINLSIILFLTVLITGVAGIIISKDSIFFTTASSGSSFAKNLIKNIIDSFSIWDFVAIEGCLQFFILLLFKKYSKNNFSAGLIIASNMIVHTWLALPFTGLGQMNRHEVQAIIDKSPSGISVPFIEPISNTPFLSKEERDILGPSAFYSKKIGYPSEEQYPVQLNNNANFFKDSLAVNFINKQAYIFLSKDTVVNTETVFNSESIKPTSYNGNSFEVSINNDEDYKYLIFLQNEYPHWQVTINGKPVKHFKVFKTFIGIKILPGESVVKYNFTPKKIKPILYINIIIFIGGLVFLMFRTKRKAK